MKKLISILMVIYVLCSFTGCAEPAEIELNPYVTVNFEGEDTEIYVSDYEIDVKGIFNDYEKALKNVKQRDLKKLLEDAITFEEDSYFSEGDKIKLEWNIDEDALEEFEEENNVELIFDDFKVTVETDGGNSKKSATAKADGGLLRVPRKTLILVIGLATVRFPMMAGFLISTAGTMNSREEFRTIIRDIKSLIQQQEKSVLLLLNGTLYLPQTMHTRTTLIRLF